MVENYVVIFSELYNFASPIFAKIDKLEDEAKEVSFEAQQVLGLDESSKKMFEKLSKAVLRANTSELFSSGLRAIVEFLSKVVVDPETVINEDNIKNVYLTKMFAIAEQKKVENKQIAEFSKKLAKKYNLTKRQVRALRKIAKYYYKGKDLSEIKDSICEEMNFIVRVIESRKGVEQ